MPKNRQRSEVKMHFALILLRGSSNEFKIHTRNSKSGQNNPKKVAHVTRQNVPNKQSICWEGSNVRGHGR